MFEFVNTPEIHRLALIIGAFVAIRYKDRYGVIPGGIIVPGFIIILFLISPIWCFTDLTISFVIYFLYKRFLAKTSYKRRTPMYIIAFLSLSITNLIALLYIYLGWLLPSLDSLSGTILPAVIAFTLTRQNPQKVIIGMMVTTTITILILIAVYSIGSQVFHFDFDFVERFYAQKETLHIPAHWLQFYIILSVSYLIYRYKNIRPGGYMVAPIAAGLLTQPISAILFIVGCIVVCLIIELICKFTLTIGLKRYALALFYSTIFVWSIEIAFIYFGSTILPFQGSRLFVIIAMMSYANDSILYEKKKVLPYMIVMILVAILSLMLTHWVVYYFQTYPNPEIPFR